jgi:hypothetical protein
MEGASLPDLPPGNGTSVRVRLVNQSNSVSGTIPGGKSV